MKKQSKIVNCYLLKFLLTTPCKNKEKVILQMILLKSQTLHNHKKGGVIVRGIKPVIYKLKKVGAFIFPVFYFKLSTFQTIKLLK